MPITRYLLRTYAAHGPRCLGCHRICLYPLNQNVAGPFCPFDVHGSQSFFPNCFTASFFLLSILVCPAIPSHCLNFSRCLQVVWPLHAAFLFQADVFPPQTIACSRPAAAELFDRNLVAASFILFHVLLYEVVP